MNLKTIKTYKGGLDRIKSNGTFSRETVEKATINFNKMVEDFALDNLFDEGISSNASDALNNEDISVKKINTDDGSWDGKITFEKQDNGAYIIYKEVDDKKVAMGWTDKAGKQAYKNTKLDVMGNKNSNIGEVTASNDKVSVDSGDISANNNYGNVSMSSVQDYQNKIDECDVLLKEKEQELPKYNSWSGVGANPNASKVREVKNDIATLKSSIHALENQQKSLEYVNLLNTDEIKNYQSKSSGNVDDVKMSLVGTTTYLVRYDEKLGMNKAEFMKIALEKYGNYDFNVIGIDGDEKNKLESLVKASETNPDLLKLYNWYYDNKGEDAASKYLDDMYDLFNQIVGQQRAKEFFSTLKDDKNIGNVVMNHLGISGKGLDDGLKSFEDGLLSWFNDRDVYSSSDYEKMYILQELSKKKNGYSVNYEVSQGIGNMLPSIFISCVPIVGQSAGTFTLGASAGGGSYHEALVSGYSKDKAIMYGLLAGSSEALLQRFLGGIPGLSDVNVTNFSTYLKAMAKEGVEEGAQQVLDSTVLRTNILGEDVDFDQLVKDVGKSAAYGALTAGILNGGAVVVKGVNSVNTNVNTNANANANTIINSSDSDTNSSASSSGRGVLLNQASNALAKRGEWLSERSKKSSEAAKRGPGVATNSGDTGVAINQASNLLKRRQEFINEISKNSSEIADSSSKSTIVNEEKVEVLEQGKDIKNNRENFLKEREARVSKLLEKKLNVSDNVSDSIDSVNTQENLANNEDSYIDSNKASVDSIELYEVPTEGVNSVLIDMYWDDWFGGNKIDKNVGEKIYEEFMDSDYTLGLHRTSNISAANSIYNEGLKLTGHLSSGAKVDFNNLDNLDLNISFVNSQNNVGFAQFLYSMQSASSYKNYKGDNTGYAMLVKIPKSANIKDIIYYDNNGVPVLKPEYVVGKVEVNGRDILNSSNTEFKDSSGK